MAEISTVAVITATPEGAEQVLHALTELAGATHQEPGCLLYSLQRGIEDPNVFLTIEKWDAPDSLAAHLQTAHVQKVVAEITDLLAAPIQVVPAVAVPAGDPAKSSF